MRHLSRYSLNSRKFTRLLWTAWVWCLTFMGWFLLLEIALITQLGFILGFELPWIEPKVMVLYALTRTQAPRTQAPRAQQPDDQSTGYSRTKDRWLWPGNQAPGVYYFSCQSVLFCVQFFLCLYKTCLAGVMMIDWLIFFLFFFFWG